LQTFGSILKITVDFNFACIVLFDFLELDGLVLVEERLGTLGSVLTSAAEHVLDLIGVALFLL